LPASHADSARKGKAVEHLVAATCVLASNSDLNALTALVDDEGVDVVFSRRGGSRTLAIQVKSRFWNAQTLASRGQFVTNVREITFRPRSDLYLLFVAVEPDEAALSPLWLVPSETFKEMTRVDHRGRRRFAASARERSADRWSRFKVGSAKDLADRILAILGEI
jgi:hypothetical protein